jgi:hypothetical protein
MNAEISEQALHDRFTRSIPLSPAEQARLEAWYAEQDKAEKLLLESTEKGNASGVIQAQIRTLLTQLRIVTQRIQEINEQNEVLRQEIVMLKQQLAQQFSGKAALAC